MTVVTALFIYCVLLIFTRARLKSTAYRSRSPYCHSAFPTKIFLDNVSVIRYYYHFLLSLVFIVFFFSFLCYDIADTFDVIVLR